MSKPPQDREQRLDALKPTRSFIVQAPAGSGKTELLIQRFLVLLALVEQPEAVVAITFTRKAAGEMRQRIIEALQKASGSEPEKPHKKQTWELAWKARERNDKLNWNLTEQPSRLRIQTIDSLCAMLVRRMPWVSRMGAAPRPEEDAGPLYRQAARRTLAMLDSDRTPDEKSKALSQLLSHRDNHIGTVELLLSTMLARRDQWLRHVPEKPEPASLREELEISLRQVIERALERLVKIFPERFKSETVALAGFAAGNLRNEDRASALNACLELREFPGTTIESLPHWLGLAEMFLTQEGTRRKQLTKNQGFPPTHAGRKAKERLSGIELKPDNIELEPDSVVKSLHALRSLPPPRFGEKQWEVLDALMLLLKVAVAQLRLVFQEEERVDFTEIAFGAQEALGPEETPTDLAFALDCRIQHLLVDEFQDTSRSHYDLLTRLIGDWQPKDDGRTLFLVGDPMQSIYGFREAEVGVFLDAWKNKKIGAIQLTRLKLSVNFRSSEKIVEWVNDELSRAFPDKQDEFAGAVPYKPSVAFKADRTSAVVVHPFLTNDLEREAGRVVAIIQEAQSKRPGKKETTAVLVRARRHLFGIASELRKKRMKFRAVEIDALGERPVVRDLMALTQALLHPGNRLAWLAILRAPWCGLTLRDLEALVNGAPAAAVWDLLQDPARQERLSPDGRERIGRLIPVLRDALAQRGRLPVRRWVEGVWIELGGPACLESKAGLEDAAAYLDLLEQSLDGSAIRDERKFAEDVDSLFAPPDVEARSEDPQLMTIHKAKGLEFDTVILPGLGRRTRPDDPRLLLWREYMDDAQPRLLLAPVREAGGGEDPLYEHLLKTEAEKRDHESTRLLYVAVTRARKHLHLLGHTGLDSESLELKEPNSSSLLAKIWGTVEPEFKEEFKKLKHHAEKDGDDDKGEEEPQGIPLRRLVADWAPPPLPKDVVWKPRRQPSDTEDTETRQPTFEWVSELQRRVGIVVHRMLHQMRAPDRLHFSEETLRMALRSEGLEGEQLNQAVSRAVSALQNTIADDRGRWILSQHEDDEREYALSAVVEGRVRRFVLDRTFVDGGKRWIIDYKTGTHAGGSPGSFLDNELLRYRAQMERYAKVIQSMDSRPIHLGLYFPMLRGWREFRPRGATG